MSTSTLTVPQFRLAPRTRKVIVVLHVISSVAILGQVWVNAVLAVIAIRTPGGARAAYSFMQDLVYTSAAPLSVLSLVSGAVLGLGTKWGVLRFRWVTAKLVLLLVVVLTGITIQGPLLEHLIAAPSPTAQAANLATTGAQLVLLAVATWLSVFKPGGRIRRINHDRPTNEIVTNVVVPRRGPSAAARRWLCVQGGARGVGRA
ncbi:MAG TPA: hypothetical protein VGO16_10725 [Pseudonocardiaceae bacterium]|jgi:hypothetical protein|nr:hypothetical protein [Pseudonocardiaceae bacterium]